MHRKQEESGGFLSVVEFFVSTFSTFAFRVWCIWTFVMGDGVFLPYHTFTQKNDLKM